jgi:hypothetical protein
LAGANKEEWDSRGWTQQFGTDEKCSVLLKWATSVGTPLMFFPILTGVTEKLIKFLTVMLQKGLRKGFQSRFSARSGTISKQKAL